MTKRLRNKPTHYDTMSPADLDEQAKLLLALNLKNSTHIQRKKARRHLKLLGVVRDKQIQLIRLITSSK